MRRGFSCPEVSEQKGRRELAGKEKLEQRPGVPTQRGWAQSSHSSDLDLSGRGQVDGAGGQKWEREVSVEALSAVSSSDGVGTWSASCSPVTC